jgi:hypothetical protein
VGDARLPIEHRDVAPLAWRAALHDRIGVSEPAIRVIAERGGW